MRYEKLDILRGMALIWMMFFHANYILEEVFQEMNFHISPFFWYILGRGVAITFIIVAGISLFLSTRNKNLTRILRDSIRRFLLLASIAWWISLVTFTFFYEQRISFGIIHFFALASLLGLLFLRLKSVNIALWVVCIWLGYYFSTIPVQTYLLIPVWLTPSNYFSADYYSICPWFGYYLIWYGIAQWLQNQGWFDRFFSGSAPCMWWISYIGRHSLFVYVIHVPIIYGILSIFYGIH